MIQSFRRGAVLLAIAACTAPTESSPVLLWSTPAAVAAASPSAFVSDGVGTDSASVFTILAYPSTDDIIQSLFDVCTECAEAEQQRIAKPAFTAGVTFRYWLPVGVRSAVMSAATGRAVVKNYLEFDPLRPAPGVFGTVTVVYLKGPGGDTLGSRTVSGATHSVSPGSVLPLSVSLQGGNVGELHSSITVTSPAGDSVTMKAGQSLELLAEVWDFHASMIDVEVPTRRVIAAGELDLTHALQEPGATEIDSAHVRLRIASPFSMPDAATITLRTATTTITRAAGLAGPGAEEKLLRLSGSEARSLLGHVATLQVEGYVSAPSLILKPGEPVPVASAIVDVFGRR